ncbi:MAG: hypothetical protein HYT98_04430 [Candidatus Sungbacteria bacterium]|nr:hypothetical protein [Candidatus Sungbacteria bacterium]
MSEEGPKKETPKPLTKEEIDAFLNGFPNDAPAPASAEASPVVNESEDEEFARLAEGRRNWNLSKDETERLEELERQRAKKSTGAEVTPTPPLIIKQAIPVSKSAAHPDSIFSGISSPKKDTEAAVSPALAAATGPEVPPKGLEGQSVVPDMGVPTEPGAPRPAPEQEPTEIGPESRETSRLSDKERLFAYRMWSGDWKAAEVPKEKDKQTPEAIEANAQEVFKLRGDELDAYEKVCRTRSALKKLEKIRGGEKDSGAKAREKIEKEKELLDAENKYHTAKDAYEKRLDRFKLDLLNDFIKSNEEKLPGLTKKQLADAALKWQHQSLLETIQNLDGNTRLLEQERERNAREIGMLRNMWEKFNQLPQWQKVAIGVGAAGLIGVGTAGLGGMVLPLLGFSAPSSVAALSVGGVYMQRRAIGGTLGAGLQAVVDKLFISRQYGKEREKVSKEEKQKTSENLNQELKDYLGNWVEDEEKKLKMMEIVDKDAKEYRARLDDITRREGKTRGWSALATGLIGGGSVLAYENWDNIVNLFQGAPKGSVLGSVNHDDFYEAYHPDKYNPHPAVPAEGAAAIEPSSVETAQEMGYIPSEPSSVETAQDMQNIGAAIEPSSVETAKEMGTAAPTTEASAAGYDPRLLVDLEGAATEDASLADKVFTVQEGDSMWKITRQMVKNGLITEEQWKDGWQNSMVEMANGKKVPIHELGLIHAGDQVRILEDTSGGIVFSVEDYPHDTLKLADNAGYAEYLDKAGKPQPQWLQDALAMKSGAKSALAEQGAELHELVLASASDNANEVIRGTPTFFNEAIRAELAEQFGNATLAHQEEMLGEIALDRANIGDLASDAWEDPGRARDLARSFSEAFGFENGLRTSEAYLANLEAFNTLLRDNEIFPSYFNRVKDVRVGEFIALAKGEASFVNSPFGYLQNQFRLYPDKWQKIASFLEQSKPGRPEKMLTLGKFIKGLVGG